MNDEQRAALVEELNSRARTMFDTATEDLLDGAEWTKSDRYDFYTMLADQLTEEAVEMFEKHLADRAATVAEPDAETVERVASAISEHGRAGDVEAMARDAIAAMPSCADDNWLDGALDSVHPVCRIDWIECEYDNPGKWTAQVSYPTGGIAPGTQADDEYIEAVGTGTTRREAILDAVQKAKGAERC